MNYSQIAAAVYQACCTYDQYLPALSPQVATSWGKPFAKYKLSPEDLLDGVDKVYAEHGSGYRPLPFDIAMAARAIRAERTERESTAAREKREDRMDARQTLDEIGRRTGQTFGRELEESK